MNLGNKKFDIVIIAGQSNAEGNGKGSEELTITFNDKVYMLVDANPYYLNENGFTGTFPTKTTILPYEERKSGDIKLGELATTFAKSYVDNGLLSEDRDLLIIKGAVGGAGFTKKIWGVDNILSDRLISMIDDALALNKENRIVCLCWHQGEHDAYEGKELGLKAEEIKIRYKENFYNQMKLIKDRYSKFDFPIIAGDFVALWGKDYKDEEDAVVNATIESLNKLGNNRFVKCSDLPCNALELKGDSDNIHFSRKSIYEIGKRYFNAYLDTKKKIND